MPSVQPIIESFSGGDLQLIESVSPNGEKGFYISGIFAQAETPNKNKRIYPNKVLSREVNRYVEEFVKQNRALSELGHPTNCDINYERVSHLITELKMVGNTVYGKAKILDTPYGRIAKTLMKEGVKFGVSTRGAGTVSEGNDGISRVCEDFNLVAIDMVADPSAPKAFVENVIKENFDYIFKIENEKKISKKAKPLQKHITESEFVKCFQELMKEIKR